MDLNREGEVQRTFEQEQHLEAVVEQVVTLGSHVHLPPLFQNLNCSMLILLPVLYFTNSLRSPSIVRKTDFPIRRSGL
jgi:hypothetical protein